MEIKDLYARQGSVELTAEVVDKSQPRTFEKFGKQGRVCNAKIKDNTGTITLTLWNEDIDKVDIGDKLKISNGYVSEWQGELQLGAGKFGKIEVVEKGSGSSKEVKKEEKPEVFKNYEEPKEELEDEDFDEDSEEEYFE
jgi:replication factor A1